MAVTVNSRPAIERPVLRRGTLARALPPLAVGTLIALIPVPQGLSANAWHYFALFAAVITGIITEPIAPAAPVGFTLLIVLPLLVYKIYPPEIKEAPEAPAWAGKQLRQMGAITRNEITLLVLVSAALAGWIGAAPYIDPAMVAILVVVLMVMLRVVSWNDMRVTSSASSVVHVFAILHADRA
jgi:di/tricarboxylate transporter